MSHRRLFLLVPLILLGAGILVVILRERAHAPTTANNTQDQAAVSNQEALKEQAEQNLTSFDKAQHSIDDTSSIWKIVNKSRALSSNYAPADLIVPDVRLRLASSEQQMHFRKVAKADLEAMFEAAQKDNVTLVFGSGYRSYALQKQFYDSYVAKDGQAAADRYSARPGTSEHQTGLAFDATSTSGKCHLEICFETMAEGKWLAAHAHEYGFTLRYKKDKETVTGYQYEPWHFRYVGRELAAELHKTGLTLEEFFELD